MKKLFLFLFLCQTSFLVAQYITVDSQIYSPQQLIEDVLIDSGCITNVVVTNVVGGNFNSSNERSYGYFDASGTNFPIQRGIVLSTGRLSNVPGPNDNLSDDTASGWVGDTDLEQALGENNTHNATIIEFDFEAQADQISFRYLFASEEYQENDESTCQYSDLFGFLIRPTSSSSYTNIALVPGTNTPVKVTTVHPNIPGECGPINEEYFGQWNNINAPINFNGQTAVLTANALVTPNQTYHVKLVIADEYNYRYDSAVFLEAGSFNLNTSLGSDRLAITNNAACNEENIVLDATNPAATNYKWFKDSVEILGENNPTYTATTAGTYSVEITISPTCISFGEITIEYIQTPVDTPNNVTACNSYTLPTLSNGDYFTATNGGGTQLFAGDNITSSQRVYVFNEILNCSKESFFDITINNTPTVDVLADLDICESYALPNLNVGNYFTQSGGNGTPLFSGDTINSSQTIYIYAETGTNPNCFDESQFEINILPQPLVDYLNDETACDSFTLQTLTNGNYFTGPNGSGTALFAGDIITSSLQPLYIFNQNGNCTAQSSFNIYINNTPTVDVLADLNICDSYTLPTLNVGNYFTQSGGNGTPLFSGDTINSLQTIYIYAETGTNPNCFDESQFQINILPQPLVDDLNDETACDSFTLQPLTNGNYFTGPNGSGTALFAADIITNSLQPLYIFNQNGNCTAQSSFNIYINNTPTVDVLADVDICESYALPNLNVGNYFTQSGGNGTPLFSGDTINSSQTIYIYAETGTNPNCFDESQFQINILPQPLVDDLNDETACDSFTLQPLTNGNYFTGPNGSGTALFAGDTITNSDTIYIYNETVNCQNQSSFEITIFPATDFSLTADNIEIEEQNILVLMGDASITYLYAVDNLNYQFSNQFFNLSEGIHTLFVQDENGCVQKEINFTIEIDQFIIPKFFTPNNDTFHDFWQVTDTENRIQEIYIFDRYGKLIQQILPQSNGWDGTINNRNAPTSDYWYRIILKDGKQYFGHFTLKR